VTSGRKSTAVVFSFLVTCFLLAGVDGWALPAFLVRFSQDPFSRPEFRNQCSTCHINPKGGGPRNPFGVAFEKNKHLVTPEFRRQWPDHFVASIPLGAGDMKATLLADGEDTILEINGQQYRLNTRQAKLEKIEPEQAAQLAAAQPAPPPLPEGKLPLRNQPTFDHHLVNLPTALPYEKGSLAMRFSHRFSQSVLGCGRSCADVGELYGFDSNSVSSIGGAYGITRRLTATLYRSPLSKTIEMGGVFQLLTQKGSEPFSAAFRVSVEGRNNFQEPPQLFDGQGKPLPRGGSYTTNLVLPVSRTISNVAEVFVVPMFNFNANPLAHEALTTDPLGTRRRNQAAIGTGASIRFRPRTALVMEWTPRVAGFHDIDSRNAYAFGLQRTTNGHVFELTLANTLATTTSRYVSTGHKEFALGFNIYRRLH
jgi:uncharacterized beta barrel domain-containing protein DUF5777